MRLTRRGKVVIAVSWLTVVIIINHALSGWNYYGGWK